jgi:mono/diheme cytochrome c family protein
VKFDSSVTASCSTTPTGDCLHSGGPQANDQGCAACHGPNGIADVAKVHPIVQPTAANP